jgi:uncharacterized damage-inducible protein DinB
MAETRRMLAVDTVPGFPPEIGRLLWELEEVRNRTLHVIEGLDQRTLEWAGPRGDENSISTLLYHIAIVEMDWLFMDIHEGELPDALRGDLPFPFVTDGRLTVVKGVSLGDHVARLERTRRVFLDDVARMSLADWRKPRSPKNEDYSVTPEWMVFHLVEHEAGHIFQVSALKSRASRFFPGQPTAGR